MITVGCTLIVCFTLYKCFDRYLDYRENTEYLTEEVSDRRSA